MGDIGDQFPLKLQRLLLLPHGPGNLVDGEVQGFRQAPDFIVGAVVYPDIVVSPGQLHGYGAHLLQGAGDLAGESIADPHGQEEASQGRHHAQPSNHPHDARDRAQGGADSQGPDYLGGISPRPARFPAVPVLLGLVARHVEGGHVEEAVVAGTGNLLGNYVPRQDMLDLMLLHPQAQPLRVAAGKLQHLPLLVRHPEVDIVGESQGLHQSGQLLEVAPVEVLLHQGGNPLAPHGQVHPFHVKKVAVHQTDKDEADGGQDYQGNGQVAEQQAGENTPGFHCFTASNLYPIPQTV